MYHPQSAPQPPCNFKQLIKLSPPFRACEFAHHTMYDLNGMISIEFELPFSTYAIVNKNLSALLYPSSDLLDPIANWMQQPRRYTVVTSFVSLRQYLCKTDTSMLGILSSSEFAPVRLHFACHKTLLSDCKSLKLSSN